MGQVQPILCNLRDELSVRAAMVGADAVVNCVNILAPKGQSTFQAVFEEGAERIARLSLEMGVERVVHISGLGVDPASKSPYIASKARGEAAVVRHRPDAVILRPSVIFGPGDNFYNRFAGMTRLGPVVPILGGATRLQPVYVDDVALAAVKGATGEAAPGIYELGGPEILTVRQVVDQVLKSTMRRRGVVNLPFWVAELGARVLGVLQTVTGGLFTNTILARDQISLLRADNVVSPGARGFAELGIDPVAPEAVIDEYLWRFRPSGQFDAIKQSAKNLRAE